MTKVAVVGIGKVGSAVVGNLMTFQGISELVLIDIDKERIEGDLLDYSHTTSFAYSPGIRIVNGDYSDCEDADIFIITAGPSILPGQNVSRIDLVDGNSVVIKEIIEKIDEYNQDAHIIMITNPVDILTLRAFETSKRDRKKIIGTGTLIDSARLRKIIANHFHINPKDVFAYMLGEHGDSSFAAWSIANICGLTVDQFSDVHQHETIDKLDAQERAKYIGHEILNRKGFTNHGIAGAVARLVRAITGDEKCILPVSVVLDGEYGISGMALSVPCIVGKDGIEKILEFPLTGEEMTKLHDSANFLKSVIS